MTIWPHYPKIYEINTWVWLSDLTEKSAHPLTSVACPQRSGTRLPNSASMLCGLWAFGNEVLLESLLPIATATCLTIFAVPCLIFSLKTTWDLPTAYDAMSWTAP
jgi:hypothetical protein